MAEKERENCKQSQTFSFKKTKNVGQRTYFLRGMRDEGEEGEVFVEI